MRNTYQLSQEHSVTIRATLKSQGHRQISAGPGLFTHQCPACGNNPVEFRDRNGHVDMSCFACSPEAILAALRIDPGQYPQPTPKTSAPRPVLLNPTTPEPEPPEQHGQILTRSQLRNLPKPEPLIDGLLPRRGVTLMVGGWGIGKTLLALSMACAVGTGVKWLGQPAHQTPVLYVAGEGAYGLDQRVSSWETVWKTPVQDDQVTFWTQPRSLAPVRAYGAPPYADGWLDIRKLADQVAAKFIILDTFSSLAAEADETKDAAWIIRQCGWLASAINGAVMLVHHPGHNNQDRARGAYAFNANSDQVLLLEGSKDSPAFDVILDKVKDGPSGRRFHLRRVSFGDSLTVEMISDSEAVSTGYERSRDLVRELFAAGLVSRTRVVDLLKAEGVSQKTAYRHVKQLIDDHVLVETGKAGRTCMYNVA
jgi:hypothetical protein